MKYLVTQMLGRAMPREQALAMNEAAREWVETHLEDGTIDAAYALLDGDALAIVNAESHDALWDLLMEYPLYWHMDWKVEPLCSWNRRLDELIGLLRNQNT